MRDIDVWFSCGSTYTYLTMMRLDQFEAKHDIRFRLRPIYLGKIFGELGRVPFAKEPQKLAYMWRDIERRAAKLGTNPKLPVPWPAPKSVVANRLAYVASKEDWALDYLKNSYAAWFEHGHVIGEEPNISNSLRPLGQDPKALTEQAMRDEVNAALEAETETAAALGVFGSPTFVVGDEIFWGDDHLEDAVNWALEH